MWVVVAEEPGGCADLFLPVSGLGRWADGGKQSVLDEVTGELPFGFVLSRDWCTVWCWRFGPEEAIEGFVSWCAFLFGRLLGVIHRGATRWVRRFASALNVGCHDCSHTHNR